MKKRILCAFLIIFIKYLINADSISTFIKTTDRRSNDFIIKHFFLLKQHNQIKILKSLQYRDDPYIEDILLFITKNYSSAKREEIEYLIRILLKSSFSPEINSDKLKNRILINKKGLDHLIQKIYKFNDPLLKCQILWLIPYMYNTIYNSKIMTEASRLISLLKSSNGFPGIAAYEEIFWILDLIENLRLEDFIEISFLIQKYSNKKEIVEKARHVSKILTIQE